MRILSCFILLSLLILGCKNKVQIQDPIPEHNSFKIQSIQVNEERLINVWTPPSYEKGVDSFPVLYMADGGIKEDFPHIANTIDKLVKAKRIPPIILIGIENTDRRRDLSGSSKVAKDEQYCPLTDGASKFRSFIIEELIPEVDLKYRTTTKKGIIGESLSGLFVMETFLQKPDLFDFYIAMDPSLWWNNHYLVKNANMFLEDFPRKKIKLWFAGSSVEDISVHTNKFAKALESNTPDDLIWKYSDEHNEKHNTIFRATKEKALIWILNE